jgi:hypothetical protein
MELIFKFISKVVFIASIILAITLAWMLWPITLLIIVGLIVHSMIEDKIEEHKNKAL